MSHRQNSAKMIFSFELKEAETKEEIWIYTSPQKWQMANCTFTSV